MVRMKNREAALDWLKRHAIDHIVISPDHIDVYGEADQAAGAHMACYFIGTHLPLDMSVFILAHLSKAQRRWTNPDLEETMKPLLKGDTHE